MASGIKSRNSCCDVCTWLHLSEMKVKGSQTVRRAIRRKASRPHSPLVFNSAWLQRYKEAFCWHLVRRKPTAEACLCSSVNWSTCLLKKITRQKNAVICSQKTSFLREIINKLDGFDNSLWQKPAGRLQQLWVPGGEQGHASATKTNAKHMLHVPYSASVLTYLNHGKADEILIVKTSINQSLRPVM